jgi:hypothetical protein
MRRDPELLEINRNVMGKLKGLSRQKLFRSILCQRGWKRRVGWSMLGLDKFQRTSKGKKIMMTEVKDRIHPLPIHERQLTVRTYATEDDRLIVEARLTDERLVPGYHWNGQPRPPGTVHDMIVRLIIGGWPITILEAEAEMPHVPHELCGTTQESVKRLVGLSISSGFSEAVRERLGGVEGCAHLTHLILTMGPAALHGYWTQHSRKRHPLPRSMDELAGLELLVNSCSLWREDGPMIKLIRDTLREKERGDQGKDSHS